MQSAAAKAIDRDVGSNSSKSYRRVPSSGDQEKGNLSLDLWKKAFQDARERLCPVRAGGHECGCLPVLTKLVSIYILHFYYYIGCGCILDTPPSWLII